MKKRVKALIIDTKISTNMLTLRQLIEFQPITDRENDTFIIQQYVLDDMRVKLQQQLYYLGRQIKMSYDDELDLELFDKVREINKQREAEYGGPCNSFEAMSIMNNKKLYLKPSHLLKNCLKL